MRETMTNNDQSVIVLCIILGFVIFFICVYNVIYVMECIACIMYCLVSCLCLPCLGCHTFFYWICMFPRNRICTEERIEEENVQHNPPDLYPRIQVLQPSISWFRMSKIEQCPICFEYKYTYQVECHHCFCKTCLERWIQMTTIHTNVSCPLCRQPICIVSEDVPSSSNLV
jgi:Ring finger domain